MSAAEDKNPWLGLARISGDHEENKRLWNGYQKYLLRPNIDEYQRQMENPEFADIVDLSDAEIHSIQTEIPDLPKEMVWFNTISLSTGIAENQNRPYIRWVLFRVCRFHPKTLHLRACSHWSMRNSQRAYPPLSAFLKTT